MIKKLRQYVRCYPPPMKSTPFLLIYSRILIGVVIVLLAILKLNTSPQWITTLMVIGLLTDVFDGIIARKLGISSEKLRVWDSNADQFFWLSVIGSVVYLRFHEIKPLFAPILIIALLEGSTYLTSYLKFKRTIATHSLLAKAWTLTILIFLIEITLYQTTATFAFCFGLGVISRLEILAIIFRLKQWTTDVPSILAVKKLNQGLPIKKSKLFNS